MTRRTDDASEKRFYPNYTHSNKKTDIVDAFIVLVESGGIIQADTHMAKQDLFDAFLFHRSMKEDHFSEKVAFLYPKAGQIANICAQFILDRLHAFKDEKFIIVHLPS